MDNTQAAYEFAAVQIENVATLIRKIASHQAEKASESAASGPELDEPTQRAEGVPEWCQVVAATNLAGVGYYDRPDIVSKHALRIHEAVEAEIARRTAGMEKHIYELEETLSEEWSKPNPCAPFVERIAELIEERDQALAEAEKFKATDVGTLVADAIRADRESDERECRREIRRLRAEVERLKARQLPDGWEMSGTLVDNRRRIAELEAEVERLSRPVDLGAVHKARVDGIDYVYDYDARQAVRNERNAREAAEAALAELRELIRTHYLMWSAADASTEWSFLKRLKSCPEDDLDAALAKFRKTKEQAK